MKLIRFLLFPIAIVYDIVTTVRNILYNTGIFKSRSFKVPIIVVGNLNVGGTGKSPQIEYLIRLLQDNYSIATLSRGYKRKTKGFQLVNNTHQAKDVGDEPLQFFSKFKNIAVAVDADRVNGITNLNKIVTPEVILLDDAFQHRKVKAGFYVLLTKYNDLYVNDFLLPTGNLRESKRGAKRANIVVVTKCPEGISEIEMQQIQEKLSLQPNQKLFFSAISYNEILKGSQQRVLETVKEEIILVTGIANANPLLKYLTSRNIKFTHLNYPDHHNFSSSDIARINTIASVNSEYTKMILTTEKDYVRLKNKLSNLYYIEIESKIINEKEIFDTEIQRFVES
mgnify:CR=1 FL=1